MVDIQAFIQSSIRIFNVSRKPDWPEYSVMAKVTGLGIIIIGILGFAVKFILTGIIRI